MKNFLKRTVAVLMIVLSISLIAPFGSIVKAAGSGPSTKGLITNTGDKITRAEWLHNLAVVFEMTVEDEIYPDNYFSDLEDTHEYYYDLLLNVNFGVIDVEAGGEVNPDGTVTRSFASHTLNYCLGYQLDSATYTFTDSALCEYPADAQVAINRGWFVLVEGKFCPDITVTDAEVNKMIKDAQEITEDKVIDENYDSTYKFDSSVIEIPDGTELSVSDNVVTITDCKKALKKGDKFAAYQNGIPKIYEAVTVSVSGNVTTVAVNPDFEGYDLFLAIDAEGITSASSFEITPDEDTIMTVTEVPQQATVWQKLRGKVKLDEIYKFKKKIDLGDGLSINCEVKMKNPKVEYRFDLMPVVARVVFDGEAEITFDGSFDLMKMIDKDEIPLGTIGVPGIGGINFAVELSLGGSIGMTTTGNVRFGFDYNQNSGLSTERSFKSKSFSLVAEVSGSAGIIAKLGVTDAPVVNAYAYFKTGGKASVKVNDYFDGKKPQECVHFSAYLYASFGVKLSIKTGIYNDSFDKSYSLWDSKTSPIRTASHYEDGKPVCTCSRGDKVGYTTPWNSHYGGGGWSGGSGSTGYDRYGKPYTIFEYTLNEDNEATITAYKGNVTALHIPETIDGYKVVGIGTGVFEKRNELRSVIITDDVISIGAYAFGKCVNLSNVKLPEKLNTLGSSAFYDCDSLKEINIPANIKNVPYTQKYDYPGLTYGKVFAECDNLKTITFSEGITNIPGIFNSCSSIQTLEIPNTVTSIDDGAFERCTGLISVKIPNSVTKIGCYAFGNCINLTDVILPKNLETLGSSAFYNCDSLNSIIIPLTLSNVPYTQKYDYPGLTYGKVFAECDNLKTVIFAEGITHIPQILNSCVSVEKIELPYTVTSIGDGAFESCSSLKTIVLPESIIRIGGYVFGNCTSLSDIILPKNLSSLGSSAFYNCDSLSTITIPAKTADFPYTQKYDYPHLTYGKLFAQCDNLKTVVFENGRKSIPKILNNCTSIESVTIPNSVESIESGAFYNCIGLKNIEYNTNVITIGDEAFYNCSSLAQFNIKESITSIGTSAFAYSGLESIEVPQNVKSLGAKAFLGCEKLKEAIIADVYIKLPSSAFEGCIALEKFVTPKSLQTIPNYTFKNCTSLKEITLNDGLTTIGNNSFENCDALTKVDIPNSVKSIGNGAFYDCDTLKDVTLGNGLEAIPNNAFEHCDVLSEIVLPYRVASIGSNAFKDCVKFTSITIPRATTKIADNAFSYLDRLTIYGVEGTYAETYVKDKGIKFVNKSVPATKVDLSNAELELARGATSTLVLNITPANFTNAVTWKSSDESIVTIDDTGKITAKGLGTATIKVDVGSVSATCKVTVVQPVTGVNIDKSSLELEALETYQLKVTVNPNNAADKAVKWTSSDEIVATVDQNGLVTTLKKGSATIKCEALDGSGKYDTCAINVKNNGVIAVTVSELESTHDYPVNCTDFWQYTVNGAAKLDVTFDAQTNIEDGFDYLYIYDSEGKEVGKYTGTTLAGKTITVTGDTVRIQLVSDKSGTAWGFKVTDVKANSGVHTHSYTETITKAATCTTTGIKTFTCICDDTYTEVIPATGHINVTIDSGKAPTKTEVGYTAGKYCNDCDTWIEGHVEIPKLEDHIHKYISVVTKEASCSEEGITTYTCTCGEKYTETIAKVSHEYVTEITKATFDSYGMYRNICKNCGYIFGGDAIISVDTPKLSATKYTYDGKTKKPTVSVKSTLGDPLIEGTDYTVKYESGRKAPGKYTVTITLIGNYEGEKVLDFDILPGKTSNITATQSASAIKLTWKKVTGATGYRIYQYNSKTKKYEKIKTTTEISYTIKKLKAGTEYKFAVKAYTKYNGETLWAASSKSIKTATEPAVPTVKITAGSKKAILKWNKVTGATGYVVYMKNSDGSYKKLGSTKSTSYTKKSLKSGKKYYFRVRAYKTVDGKNIYGSYKTYSVKVK